MAASGYEGRRLALVSGRCGQDVGAGAASNLVTSNYKKTTRGHRLALSA